MSVLRIEKGNAVFEDTENRLAESKNGITCGCENPQLQMVSHIDGVDFYAYQYKCNCGNCITVTKKREETEVCR